MQHGFWTLKHLLYTVQNELTLGVADNLMVRTLTPLPQAGLCHACLQSHLFRRKARDQRSNPPPHSNVFSWSTVSIGHLKTFDLLLDIDSAWFKALPQLRSHGSYVVQVAVTLSKLALRGPGPRPRYALTVASYALHINSAWSRVWLLSPN